MGADPEISTRLENMRLVATYRPPVHLEDFCEQAAESMSSVGLVEIVDIVGDQVTSNHERKKQLQGKVGFARFTNRLLGLTLGMQTKLFDFFVKLYDASVKNAISAGTYNPGVDDIKSIGGIKLDKKEVAHRDELTGAETIVCELTTDEGMPWGDALELLKKRADVRSTWDPKFGENDGFYEWLPPIARKKGRREIVLILERHRPQSDGRHSGTVHYRQDALFRFYFPHKAPANKMPAIHCTPRNPRAPPRRWAIHAGGPRVNLQSMAPSEYAVAQRLWTCQFKIAGDFCAECSQCRRLTPHMCIKPETTRFRKWVLLSGRLLTIWDVVHDVYGSRGSSLRVHRAVASDNTDDARKWRAM